MTAPNESLVAEHKLIERMLRLVKAELKKMGDSNNVNAVFINDAVDFMSNFVLNFHTGKEESVFIPQIRKKQLSKPHRNILDELLKEHSWEKDVITKLAKDRGKFIQGNNDVIPEIMGLLGELVDYFPKHFHKEDNRFFEDILDYFSAEEQEKLSSEINDFERNFIRNVYTTKLAGLEK